MKPRPGNAGCEAQGRHPSSIPQPHVPSQTTLPWMHYVSVACVVGIIAGFCMGPGGSGAGGAGGGGAGMGAPGEQGAAGFAGRWQDQRLSPFPDIRPWFIMLHPTSERPPQDLPAPYIPRACLTSSSSSLLLGQAGRKPWQPFPDLSGGVTCSHHSAAGEYRPAPNRARA